MRRPDPSEAAVLVARDPARAAGLLTLLRAGGLDPVAAPVIERAPIEDRSELDAARERLARGDYTWVAITSVNAVDALLGASHGDVRHDPSDAAAGTAPGPPQYAPGQTRWAAVGPATERALAARGVVVDLVPRDATGAGLAAEFPRAPRAADLAAPQPPDPQAGPRSARVLLPLGDLAADTVPDGLAAKGWSVDVMTAYRTLARALPASARRRYDVVVVASGSAARQVASQLGPQPVVAIGGPSARASRDVGHTVLAVAARPTDEALCDAVLHVVGDSGHPGDLTVRHRREPNRKRTP